MGSNNNTKNPPPPQQQQQQPTGGGGYNPNMPYGSGANPTAGYGPNANPSGSDPRGVGQNQSQYQQNRYEQQQGPLANQTAYNYGQASTTNTGDYNNSMDRYNNFLGQPQQQQPTSSPGGGGSPEPKLTQATHDPATVSQWLSWQATQPGADPILQTPEGIDYYTKQILSKPDGLNPTNTDYWKGKSTLAQFGGAVGAGGGGGGSGPLSSSHGFFQNFASGGGDISMDPAAREAMTGAISRYKGFADTGGYSPEDIANLRARGISPIRAAYANAERGISQQRALQGGYSPNATATLAKMAREQGQSAADASQNVEAGIVNSRNANELAGMAGMGGVGGQLGNMQAGIDESNMGRRMTGAEGMLNADQLQQQGFLGAMQGMTSMYGATPGMASTFGNQAINLTGQGGQFGNELYGNDINNQRNPGAFDTTMNRVGQVTNAFSGAASPYLDYFGNRQQQPQTQYDPANYPIVGPDLPPPDYSDQYYGYGG